MLLYIMESRRDAAPTVGAALAAIPKPFSLDIN
jgi:hypothetical protein